MPSIRDFSGGVVNQVLQNKDTGAGVLFDCKNVLSSWNGELRKRTGTRLLKGLEGNSKIIPYRLPNGDDMIMILRDKIINCYTFDEKDKLIPYKDIRGGERIDFPKNWVSNTNGNWTVSAIGLNADEQYFPVAVWPAVNGIVDTDINTLRTRYDARKFYSDGWSYSISNTNPFVFGSCKIQWRTYLKHGNRGIVGLDPVLQFSDDGTNWTSIKTDVTEPEYNYVPGGSTHVYADRTYCEYFIYNNSYTSAHKYWKITFSTRYIFGDVPESDIGNVDTRLAFHDLLFVTEGTSVDLVFNNCPYENEDFDAIKWSQNGSTLTMACAGKSPYQIKISGGQLSDGVFAPTDIPSLWDTIGYPSSVTYYQNRLWFAGFDVFSTRVYSSAFGKFDSFEIDNPIKSTSPISVDGTEISNVIENIWGGNNALYCLSADGISMIDAQGAIVATDQIEFKLRNREPVDGMTPTVKDDVMIYLGRNKRKILITDYDFVVQRFKANCISDNYNDFFQPGIKELHYIPRRSSLIYGVLYDGNMFAMLFDIDKGKNALFPFSTAGDVKDLQPIKHGDETILLSVTQTPSYQYFLEEKYAQADQKIMDFMTKEEKEIYTDNVLKQDIYLDHSMKYVFDEPLEEVRTPEYVVGTQLEVIADGIYLGAKTVVVKTEQVEEQSVEYTCIELDEPASEVIVGYAYDSYAVIKFVSPYNLRKFPKEISANFINTGYLEMGNTFDSLEAYLQNMRESVILNNKPILYNGNYTKTFDKQAFETPYIIIRSNVGLPFIITGLDYKVDTSNYQGGV